MTKIIPLNNQAYLQYLKQSRDILKKAEDDLFIEAINLCSCNSWREWTEEREDGEKYEFDTEMIRASGDKNAILLVEVMAVLNEAREGLG